LVNRELRGYGSIGYGNDEIYEEWKRNRKPEEIFHTISKLRIEDSEGDVFLSLELEKENVQNTKPNLWLLFYVSGIIYLTILPYFVVYNVIMLIVFTKFVDVLLLRNIELFNVLSYGFIGVQG